MNRTLLLLAVLALWTASACNENEETTGSMELTVVFSDVPVVGATVITEPETVTAITGQDGIARLVDIPTNAYTVRVRQEEVGGATAVLQLNEHPVLRHTIILGSSGRPPTLDLLLPSALPDVPSRGFAGRPVVIQGTVEFGEGILGLVRITSDRDGEVYSENYLGFHDLTLNLSDLSRGLHELTVEAVDTDNEFVRRYVGYVEVTDAPPPGRILSVEPEEFGNRVRWTAATAPNFSHYQVEVRHGVGGREFYGERFDNPEDTVWVAPGTVFGLPAFYRVTTIYTVGTELISISSPAFKVESEGLSLGLNGTIHHVIADPDRPYVYLMAEHDDFALLFLNTETLRIDHRVDLPNFTNAAAMGPDGDNLYLAMADFGEIVVVDLDRRRVGYTMQLETTDSQGFDQVMNVRPVSEGRIAYTWGRPFSVRVYLANRITGDTVASIPVPGPQATLAADTERGLLYVASGRQVRKYSVDNDEPQLLGEATWSEASFFSRDECMKLSADGGRLYHQRRVLDTEDLSLSLGSFPTDIVDVDPERELGLGRTQVYNLHDETIVRALPTSVQVGALREDRIFVVPQIQPTTLHVIDLD